MRHMGMNRKGFEFTVALWIIFFLVVLVILLLFSKSIFGWIGTAVDKIFGF